MSDHGTQNPASYENVIEAQSRYTEYLLNKKNVVGVSVGLSETETDGDLDAPCYCLVVLVTVKVDYDDLAPEDRIPDDLDGVRVRVQEIGEISAQANTFSAGG